MSLIGADIWNENNLANKKSWMIISDKEYPCGCVVSLGDGQCPTEPSGFQEHVYE